ncbi:MAG: hypothetical protein WC071_03705 [Victivallaceae bacterium]
MKFLNGFLSILILLLAAASAVFSYFLFEKREQLVKGWEKMAIAINQTAAALDAGSGTTAAKELAPQALSHEKYADLEKILPKISKQAQEVIKERDELSEAIRKMATVFEMENTADLGDFKKIETYSSNKNKVVSWIEEIKERQDNTLQMICDSANKLGVSISKSALKSSDYASEYRKFDSKISSLQSRVSAYNNKFSQIASITDSPAPDLSDSGYSRAISGVTDSVQKLKNNYNEAKNSLASTQKQVNQLKDSLKDKDGQITGLNNTVVKKESEVARLKVMLGGKENEKLEDTWIEGSAQARKAVQGKVIDVNRKYGFIVVDLGSDTKVMQKIGNKVNPVDPKIPGNVEMVVARGLDSDNSEYVGKIKLVKVHSKCSIANIVPGSTGDKNVRIGDTVYFSSDEISKMSSK